MSPRPALVSDGRLVIRAGECSRKLFFVVNGSLEVICHTDDDSSWRPPRLANEVDSEGNEVDHCRALFGEAAFLCPDDIPLLSNVSVRAKGLAHILELERDALFVLASASTDLHRTFLRGLYPPGSLPETPADPLSSDQQLEIAAWAERWVVVSSSDRARYVDALVDAVGTSDVPANSSRPSSARKKPSRKDGGGQKKRKKRGKFGGT